MREIDQLAGTPCWIELNCTDDAATQEFYAALFDWEYQSKPDPATGRYTLALADGKPAAGIYVGADDTAPEWTLHLSVHNIHVSAERVRQLGGQLALGPVDIPGRGAILHVIDPSGAHVVFWDAPSSLRLTTGEHGTFTGADLNTHDGQLADDFYCPLFGFTSQQIGDGVDYDYVQWRLANEPVLYRYVMGPEFGDDTAPHWMTYFGVAADIGVDETASTAVELGGAIVVPPYDSPWGRIAVLADIDGTNFSVIDHSLSPVEHRAEVDDPNDD